jgi:tetratricopeptide (TPR) repeat protein
MKKTTAVSLIALGLALAGGNVAPDLGLGIKPAAAQKKEEKKDGPKLSAKVGKPLQEADALIKAKNFKGALAKIKEVEAIPGKTPYEQYVTDELEGIVQVNLGDYGAAARVFENTLASGNVPADQQSNRVKAVTQLYYQAKNYPKAIEWAQKYNKDAQDPEIQLLVGQAYYIQKQFKPAADAMRQTIKYAEAKGQQPKEDWLQLLMSAEYEQGNTAGVQATLEQLVQRNPQPKYWQDLLSMMEKNMRGSTKSSLDIYRLMLATGTMKDAQEYSEMTELALQQGLPGEAKQVVEKGMQAGVLGQGPQKERHTRLLNMANTQVATDQKQLESGVKEARAQKTGDALVKFGEAYASYGQYDKAIQVIQEGIAKGVKDKDDAQLRLGLAHLGAGQRQQALTAFKAITPNSNASQIARLWTIQSGSRQTASAK